jgi:hypothetical protein
MCLELVGGCMSGENRSQATVEAVAPERVLAVVADGEPRTATEIAEAVDCRTVALADTLEHLRERDALASKTVGDEAVRIWYPPAGSDPSQPADDDPEDLGAIVAEMDVPGTSEMMRQWRRDAVREAAEYLRERRRATAAEIRDDVFEIHPAGYDDAYVWWETVRPRLAELPGVEAPAEDDDGWRYVPLP